MSVSYTARPTLRFSLRSRLGNEIDDDGATYLADGLKLNTTLQSIDLWGMWARSPAAGFQSSFADVSLQ